MEWLHRLFILACCICSYMECEIIENYHTWTSPHLHKVAM